MYSDNSGIYSITNIENNKRYIGQASSFCKRFSIHISTLRNNRHDNSHLQNAWNKYGQQAFKFELLEELEIIDKILLAEREQYWMDYYNCYDRDYGYNINPSSTENPMLGQTHTEEARQKISEAAKGRIMNEENKERLITSRTNKPSKAIRKIPLKEAKHEVKRAGTRIDFEYYVTTLEGVEHVFTNLAEFCALNNLSRTHLANMISKGNFYKGWSGYKTEIEKEIVINDAAKMGPKRGRLFEYYLTDVKGNEYVFRDLSTFCKDNSISKNSIHNLIEKHSYYKGWKGYKIQIK